jgi:hypothetical protein
LVRRYFDALKSYPGKRQNVMIHVDPAAYLVAISALLCVASLATANISRRQAKRMQIASAEVASRIQKARNNPEKVLGKKGVPYIYYLLHPQLVKSLYDQLPAAARASKQIVRESSRESSLSILAHILAFLNLGFKWGSQARITSQEEHNSDSNLQRMYRTTQDHLRDSGILKTFDLDDGVDMAPAAALNSVYIRIEQDYGLDAEEQIKSAEAWCREQQEKQGAQELLDLDGLVAIRTLCRVEHDPHDGSIVLRASSSSAHGVSILARCAGESIGVEGCAQLNPGDEIRMTCVGEVIGSDRVNRQLQIRPIAAFTRLR